MQGNSERDGYGRRHKWTGPLEFNQLEDANGSGTRVPNPHGASSVAASFLLVG